MVVSKHQKLMWQLLCQAGNTGKIKFHKWIGFKRKAGKEHDDGVKLLQQIYPNMKLDEIENLVKLSTKKELKEWVESLTSAQFQKIEKFFETMPKLTHTLEVVNPNTKKKNTIVLEGLTDFFA